MLKIIRNYIIYSISHDYSLGNCLDKSSLLHSLIFRRCLFLESPFAKSFARKEISEYDSFFLYQFNFNYAPFKSRSGQFKQIIYRLKLNRAIFISHVVRGASNRGRNQVYYKFNMLDASMHSLANKNVCKQSSLSDVSFTSQKSK